MRGSGNGALTGTGSNHTSGVAETGESQDVRCQPARSSGGGVYERVSSSAPTGRYAGSGGRYAGGAIGSGAGLSSWEGSTLPGAFVVVR